MSTLNEITLTPMICHLVPAIRNWLLENNLTPEIIVDAEVEGTDVPMAFVKNGSIVISISPLGCSNVDFHEGGIALGTRFNKIHTDCFIPWNAVMAVRSREHPIMVPFNGGARIVLNGKGGEERKVDKIDVGKVEFSEEIRATKAGKGRFGVVDGSKND